MYMTPVELRGSGEQCEIAKRLIDELTEEEPVMCKYRKLIPAARHDGLLLLYAPWGLGNGARCNLADIGKGFY